MNVSAYFDNMQKELKFNILTNIEFVFKTNVGYAPRYQVGTFIIIK
jgi:hypothetical protein